MTDEAPYRFIDVRLFGYRGGIPDLPEADALEWSFEMRDGPHGLSFDRPTVIICHAMSDMFYKAWIDWLLEHLEERPDIGVGLLFVSSEPLTANNSVNRVKTERSLAVAGEKAKRERQMLDSHIRVLRNELPFGAVRSRSEWRVRDVLDEFVHWLWKRPSPPPDGQFHKVWDPLDRGDQEVSSQITDFVTSAAALIASMVLPEPEAKVLRAAIWEDDEISKADTLVVFVEDDTRYHASLYPLDSRRQSLRHSWLKHRIMLPLREAERPGTVDRKRIFEEVRTAWVDMVPKLLDFLQFWALAARTDPVARAAVYLLYADERVRAALAALQDRHGELKRVLERAAECLREMPVVAGHSAAITEARNALDQFDKAMKRRADLLKLKVFAEELDRSLDRARVASEEVVR